MDLTPEEIKAIAAATVEAMKTAGVEVEAPDTSKKDMEIERLKQEIVDLKGETVKKDEKLAEFAEKEKTAAEQLKADHNAKVEARKAQIMQFNEPEALEFEKLFKDKPENAIFMEKYAVTDTRAESKQKTALNFSEKEQSGTPKKSLTERQIEAGKHKNKAKE